MLILKSQQRVCLAVGAGWGVRNEEYEATSGSDHLWLVTLSYAPLENTRPSGHRGTSTKLTSL